MARDLAGHVLGEARRADADDRVARTGQLRDRADVPEGRGPRAGRLAPALAGPEDRAAEVLADRRAHLAREEEADLHRSTVPLSE